MFVPSGHCVPVYLYDDREHCERLLNMFEAVSHCLPVYLYNDQERCERL